MAQKKKFYAVRVGRNPGIYHTWDECKRETLGYKGAVYKGFATLKEAEGFMDGSMDESIGDESGVSIYVDGSYSTGRYSWGMAVYESDKLTSEDCGVGTCEDAASIRNVAGEVNAAEEAVKWAEAHAVTDYVIYHDYIGISEWAMGRWKANNPTTRAYADFMSKRRGAVRFRKVAGHTGIKGNERADKLARSALGI